MTETEIKSIGSKLADIARVLADADPADKAEIFRQLGLKLTYHPGRRGVEAEIDSAPCGFFESVRVVRAHGEVGWHRDAKTGEPVIEVWADKAVWPCARRE